jgi:glycosyltransferase involved in cell wall biosynthesis
MTFLSKSPTSGSSGDMFLKVLVAQRGAREHFLVARALKSVAMLERLVVDYHAGNNGLVALFAKLLPGVAGCRARSARIEDLTVSEISDLGLFGLALKGVDRLGVLFGKSYIAYEWSDRQFARVVARQLGHETAFFGYSYGALEALHVAKNRGCLAIVGQIDPGELEEDAVEAERERWPIFESPGKRAPASYWARNRQEWEAAHVILVNSKWTADAIVRDGADPAKIEILPLAYEVPLTSAFSPVLRSSKDCLQVLWLGTVGLRKGIPYLLEAAKRLVGEPVEFTIAGPLQINRQRMLDSPANVRWVGPIPRSEASAYYAAADVFVLPTISDGFAITQLEAMAHGVPVISTWNCGDVVVDGQNGYRVPARDADALVESIMKFVRNRDLSPQMFEECHKTSRGFGLAAYAEGLHNIILRRMEQQKARNK